MAATGEQIGALQPLLGCPDQSGPAEWIPSCLHLVWSSRVSRVVPTRPMGSADRAVRPSWSARPCTSPPQTAPPDLVEGRGSTPHPTTACIFQGRPNVGCLTARPEATGVASLGRLDHWCQWQTRYRAMFSGRPERPPEGCCGMGLVGRSGPSGPCGGWCARYGRSARLCARVRHDLPPARRR